MTDSRFKGAVDRISGGEAVILLDGRRHITLPMDRLPENLSEGDVVEFTARIDYRTKSERLSDSENLAKKLQKRG